MFNMTNIGRVIAKRRKELNLTQLELADQLLVSYQAVSQWENGKSMPELSNLTRLAEVLDLPLDQLLGQKEVEVVERVVSEQQLEEEDLIEAAPYIKPEAMKAQVANRIFDLGTLTALAPFLDSTTLKKYAASGSFANLIALAPFLEEEHLKELILGMDDLPTNLHQLVALAPFVSSKTIYELLRKSSKPINATKIIPLAPFLKGKHLNRLLDEGLVEGLDKRMNLIALAPFLSQEQLQKRVHRQPNPTPQPTADDVEFVPEEPVKPEDPVTADKIDQVENLLHQLKQMFQSGK